MCFDTICNVKLLSFVWFGATSCLIPFLSLHMRSLGIPLWEATIISGIVPFLQFLTCPFVSCCTTYSPSYKKTTLWSLLFTVISALLLVFTPPVPQAIERAISMQFQCGPEIEPTIIVNKCNHQCEDNHLLRTGIETFFTECHADCPGKKGNFKNTADLCFDDKHGRVCYVVEVNNTLSENFTFGIYLAQEVKELKNECHYHLEGVTWHQRYFHHVSCPIILKESSSSCVLTCHLQEVTKPYDTYKLSGVQNCLSDGPETINFAIYVYLGLRALFHICLGLSSILVERAIAFVLKVHRKSCRRYAIWPLLASTVITPLAGLIIDHGGTIDKIFNYKLLFSLFCVLTVASIVLLSSIEVEGTTIPATGETVKIILQVIKTLEISIVLLLIFLLGSVNGFFDTFLFWYLEDISCPYYVMGLTISVGIVIGLPFMLQNVLGFVKKILPTYLLAACFVLQCVRCLGYFFTENYWWFLMVELANTLAFHVLWVSVSTYSSMSMSRESCGPFRSFSGAVHYGVGRSCGAFAGGVSMMYFGFRLTFLALAVGTGAFGFVLMLGFSIYHFAVKKKARSKLEEKNGGPSNVVTDIEDNADSLLMSSFTLPPINDVSKFTEEREEQDDGDATCSS